MFKKLVIRLCLWVWICRLTFKAIAEKMISKCNVLWTHESLIYKRLMSKICDNVRHYITTAIQWSSDVKVLYWWKLITKKLKRSVCKDCLYSTLLINHCIRSLTMIWYEHIVISWHVYTTDIRANSLRLFMIYLII